MDDLLDVQNPQMEVNNYESQVTKSVFNQDLMSTLNNSPVFYILSQNL